ncbi:MAG: glycosyltransferase [Heliobacteriaceae bacterium]|jgi:glycosyltransferase involved in cell wall biosynthesis|nr:glycosyltransferase [Heliobacteriaceae bacterium]
MPESPDKAQVTDAACPKVSIVVPVYNVEKYLRQCLDSLVRQTLQDIEIICVNDGSTDRSLEIIKSYASEDSRIKIIDKQNAGYGHSCNTGFDAAVADYIGIIEPDDFADVNMFSDLYALITENDADAVKSEWYDYTGKNKKTIKCSQVMSKLNAGKISGIKDKKELLKTCASVWSFLYKKSFLNDNNIRFLETPGASFQDTSFNFKVIVLAKDIYITNSAYVYYRQDNSGCSTKRKDGWEFIYKEYAEIDRFLDEHPEFKDIYRGIKFAKQYKAYCWNLKRVHPKYRKKVFERFAEEFKNYYKNGELDNNALELSDRNKIMMLINEPKRMRRRFQRKLIETTRKDFRRQFISIRINLKRASIEVLGRQILRIES